MAPPWLAKHLRVRAGGRRLPLSGTCELTARCNLRCSHCYIIDRGGQGPDRGQQGPLGDLARAPASPDAACITCSLALVCSQCLGFGALAGGDPSQPDPFLCALAKARREALEELRPETRWTL